MEQADLIPLLVLTNAINTFRARFDFDRFSEAPHLLLEMLDVLVTSDVHPVWYFALRRCQDCRKAASERLDSRIREALANELLSHPSR